MENISKKFIKEKNEYYYIFSFEDENNLIELKLHYFKDNYKFPDS